MTREKIESTPGRHIRIGDELIRYSDSERVIDSDFAHDFNVILIHGFTAHGDYLHNLAKDLGNNGFNVFIYNYYSLNGILRAANCLSEMLVGLDELSGGIILKRKVGLVCHSMGGLVGRSVGTFTDAKKFVSSIVTLGTPHDGTLSNWNLLKILVKSGEYLTGKPLGYRSDCESAKELIKQDSYNDVGLISSLNEKVDILKDIPMLGISGGRKWLEVGKNQIANVLANRSIQRALAGKVNDGLVAENSSDMSNVLKNPSSVNYNHLNDYSDYKYINHSYLPDNQAISIKISTWLKNISKS